MAKKMIKSSRKTTKKLRKFEDGGMAGKGPLQPAPKKEKTVEELANETVSRLTTIPGYQKQKHLLQRYLHQLQKQNFYLEVSRIKLKRMRISRTLKIC